MYVLVRKDLSASQISVQAAHASIEAARSFLDNEVEHPHLIICETPDIFSLLRACGPLDEEGIQYRMFYEEDIGNEATALATELVYGEKRKFFKKWKLLNFNSKENLIGTL